MKTYVIHEVSSDNLASHLDVEGSKLLAVIPESFDSTQVSAVLSNVFSAKIPAPSSTISKALKYKNGGTSLSQKLIAGLKNSSKAMTADDFFSQPEFSDHYSEGQIRKCLYSLSYNKKIRSNGSGKYSAK